MRVLLDTHTLIWWKTESARLSPTARAAIAGAVDVHVSIATVWEIAIKVGLGKLADARQLLTEFDAVLAEEVFLLLPITVAHVRAAGMMQTPHRDPFDRLLAAQAMAEGLALVTADSRMAEMGATVVW